ncbi:MAG: hypothetical protein KL801_06300 [Mesorhizobium sp.]|nr:hypothetical protein [Mesorhizobium sp.]
MSVLYVVARVDDWRSTSFSARVDAIKAHYDLADRDDMQTYERLFERAGIGIFVAWNQPSNLTFRHFHDEGPKKYILTNFPFGYSAVSPGPVESVGARLTQRLRENNGVIKQLHPPLTVLAIDETAGTVEFWNDALGLSKILHLKAPGLDVFSNRPIAAHFLAAKEPTPSVEGWAAQQVVGAVGSLTPYSDLSRLLSGSRGKVTRRSVTVDRTPHEYAYFVEPPAAEPTVGLNRVRDELHSFGDFTGLQAALSGGRDSRVSAAVFASDPKTAFRTNYPPELELVVARQLVERLPKFARFKTDEQLAAIDTTGKTFWTTKSPTAATQTIEVRATQRTRIMEGFGVAGSLASDARGQTFNPQKSASIGIAGDGGESAKAYYWSPRMASGAFARSLSAFQKDIKTPLRERIRSHPLTSVPALHFVKKEYEVVLTNAVADAVARAHDNGIYGYRFFDYWWLSERFAAGQSTGYNFDHTVMPFMAPEFTATGLQMPPQKRATASLLTDLAAHYQPQWAEVPYFDQLIGSSSLEMRQTYRRNELLWEGEGREWFMDAIHSAHHFGEPYDHPRILEYFETAQKLPHVDKLKANPKGYGLVYRFAFAEFCEDVSAKIRAIKGSSRTHAPAGSWLRTLFRRHTA